MSSIVYLSYGTAGAPVNFQEYSWLGESWEGAPREITTPAKAYVAFLEQGGGVNHVTVQGQHILDTAGGAEGQACALLTSCLGSSLGDLIGPGGAREDCFFQSGQCQIVANRLLAYSLTFVQGARERDDLAAEGTGGEGVSGGGGGVTSDGLWTLGGVSLGVIAHVKEMQASRSVQLTRIPRSYGMRIADVIFGKKLTITLGVWVAETSRGALEAWVHNLQTQIGTQPVTLAGDGQSWTNCYLIGCSPAGDDERAGNVDVTVEKQLS